MNIDICKIVFDTVETQLPDIDQEFNAIMQQLRRTLDAQTFNNLEAACNERVAAAQQAAFEVGWQLRGQV